MESRESDVFFWCLVRPAAAMTLILPFSHAMKAVSSPTMMKDSITLPKVFPQQRQVPVFSSRKK
eukprot:11437195-Ditylum_brightwellii.AAC.1